MKEFVFEKWRNIINFCLKNSKESTDFSGLVNGKCGVILLCAQLYQVFKDKFYLDRLYKESDAIMSLHNANSSLGYGVSGVAWTMNLIGKFQLFSETEDWFTEVDLFLEMEFFRKIQESNVDYFEGAMGILFYFLEKENYPKDKLDSYIASFCKYVSNHAQKEDWIKTQFNAKENKINNVINLGVPHGISGVLLLLLIIKEKRETSNNDSLIETIIELIISFELKNENKYSYYPLVYGYDTQNFSIMGWCYGDLMVGYAIYKAGMLLNIPRYVVYGMDILVASTFRGNNFKDKLVLCHGFTSLFYIYHCIYHKTKNEIFKIRSLHWKNKAIELFSLRYKKYLKCGEDDFFENSSLFFGYPGFFLTLSHDENNFGKDCLNCLML